MTKHDFVSFVSGELRQGAVRFSLAFKEGANKSLI